MRTLANHYSENLVRRGRHGKRERSPLPPPHTLPGGYNFAGMMPSSAPCACDGSCPRCQGSEGQPASGMSLAGQPQNQSAGAAATPGCGTTPSGESLGPTNPLNRKGKLRKRPKLCKAKFLNLELAHNPDKPGLRGLNQGSIQVSAPEGLVAGLTGCDPTCLVFRQFVKIRSFEDGQLVQNPITSCDMTIAASNLETTFFEEQTHCFVDATPGAGTLTWSDAPGRQWPDPSTEPTRARWEFTVRVMIWDRCLGIPVQTREGTLILLKNGTNQSAQVTPFRAVSSDFSYLSPMATCP